MANSCAGDGGRGAARDNSRWISRVPSDRGSVQNEPLMGILACWNRVRKQPFDEFTGVDRDSMAIQVTETIELMSGSGLRRVSAAHRDLVNTRWSMGIRATETMTDGDDAVAAWRLEAPPTHRTAGFSRAPWPAPLCFSCSSPTLLLRFTVTSGRHKQGLHARRSRARVASSHLHDLLSLRLLMH